MICAAGALRSRIENSPSSYQPMSGPMATPQWRTFPSLASWSSVSNSASSSRCSSFGIVYLVQVDVVGVQPSQALLAGEPDKLGIELLDSFPVSHSLDLVVDVVAELGADYYVLPSAAQRLGQYLLAETVAVRVRGIEEVDPKVHGRLEVVACGDRCLSCPTSWSPRSIRRSLPPRG